MGMWVKMHPSRAMNRKLREAGFAARGLDEAAICQVALDDSDGFISEHAVEVLALAHKCRGWRKLTEELVRVGRWATTTDGWLIHDYLEYNWTKAQWDEYRAKRQAAGARGGQASGEARASAHGEARAEAQVQAVPPRSVSVSNPPPPPLKPGYPTPEAEAFVREVVATAAIRQLDNTKGVRNRSAWLAKAKTSIETEWGNFLAGQIGLLSIEAAVDKIEPPPPPPEPSPYTRFPNWTGDRLSNDSTQTDLAEGA